MNMLVPLRLEHCYLVATPKFTRIQTGLTGRAGYIYFRSLFPDLLTALNYRLLKEAAFFFQNYPMPIPGYAAFVVVTQRERAERNIERSGHPHTVSLSFDQAKLALAECESRVAGGEYFQLFEAGIGKRRPGRGRASQ